MSTDLDVHDIDAMSFGILSADNIRKMAVCKLDSAKLTGPGSVYDERMGMTDTDKSCPTCGLKTECWGHFGYIDLVEPVLHPMLYKVISTFLKCFCKICFRLIILEEQIELAGFHKLKGDRKFVKILEKLEKTDICAHCSAPQPKICYKSKDMTISMEYKQKKGDGNAKIGILLTVDDIKKIFDGISDHDVSTLGLDPSLTHPRDFILTAFPVIPPCSRPFVMADGNTCDDDLTYQYNEIIKINNQLSTPETIKVKKNEKREDSIQRLSQSLKFRISTLINNSKGRAKHPTDSRPLKCLKQRLVGKGGRIRFNLMGKRVNQSARTVIGAEPTLKLNQLGVPHEVCQILTKPEVVQAFNIDWLTELVNGGKANFVTITRVKNGETFKTRLNLQYALHNRGTKLLYGDVVFRGTGVPAKKDKKGKIVIPKDDPRYIRVITGNELLQDGDQLIRNGELAEVIYPKTKQLKLRYGDIVERHLMKGDSLLLNRQPKI